KATLLHFFQASNRSHVLLKGVNFRYFKADAVFATGAGSLVIEETNNGTNSGAFVGAMIGVADHAQGRAGGTFTHTNFTLVRTATSGVFGSHTPLGYVTDNCTITASAAG